MYKVARTFNFSASHIIHGLDTGHPEATLHGHNYTVKVELKIGSSIKPNLKGFVIDARKFDIIESWIKLELNRKHLNDVFGGMPPTNENICHWLYFAFKGMLNDVSSVELSDMPGSSCKYEE